MSNDAVEQVPLNPLCNGKSGTKEQGYKINKHMETCSLTYFKEQLFDTIKINFIMEQPKLNSKFNDIQKNNAHANDIAYTFFNF